MKVICDVNSVLEAKKMAKLAGVGVMMVKMDFLSLDTNGVISIQNFEKIIEYAHKHLIQVGLYMEKLFSEDDLLYVKMLLKNDIFKQVDYFFYSDFGIYQILIEMGYSEKTVYYAPTYLTNYYDVNVYQKLNNYVVVSCEITSKEVKEIVDNSKNNIIVEAFGMACCFYSKRPLVSNYLKVKEREGNNIDGKLALLKEETRDNYYHLVEDGNGVRIYEEKHYYLASELDGMKQVPFIMVHCTVPSKKYNYKIVSLYSDYVSGIIDAKMLEETLMTLDVQLYKGAYENKTILLKDEVKE